ncbi:ABC transporter substrate-binding protein [Actinacidiphila oryziradicis]|nr:extracellular solute-binding protein [Actinacidiphila oryziradicis]
MRRRELAAVAGPLALLMSVAACSSDKTSVGGDGKASLTYGVWDVNQVPARKKIISAFEAKNPNIKVSVQLTPYNQYFTKLQAAATGGQAPDVFWMNGPNFQLYASNGVIKPLTDLKPDTSVHPGAYPTASWTWSDFDKARLRAGRGAVTPARHTHRPRRHTTHYHA